MIKKHGDLDEVLAKALNTVEFNPRRSSLFWYLYRIHDDLLRRAKGGRIKWSHVCIDLDRVDIHLVQMNALMTDSMDRNARGVCS